VDSEGIRDDVAQLIWQHINSIEHLEVLLLLFRNPQKAWTADDVSKELYTTPESAARWLSELHSSRLVVLDDTINRCYRFDAGVNDVAVSNLAAAYKERRVRIINMIISKPLDQIRSFADAFKFKKKDDKE
jgi:hypothetical protein